MDVKLFPSFPDHGLEHHTAHHSPVTRAEVVREARTWIDTPYHHMARTKGVAVDCIGLLLGVTSEIGLLPKDVYVPNYGRLPDGKTLRDWCDSNMVLIDKPSMSFGDVLLLTIDVHPQHLGILADYRYGGFSIIHACGDPSCHPPRVIETRLMFSRRMQFVAAYRLPGVL